MLLWLVMAMLCCSAPICTCCAQTARQHAATRRQRSPVTCAASTATGLITAPRFVDIVSTSIAQTFGIYPRKGVVAAGSDADVIIFDPSIEHTITAASHHSAMDTNIYEGMRIRGKVTVFKRSCLCIFQIRPKTTGFPVAVLVAICKLYSCVVRAICFVPVR